MNPSRTNAIATAFGAIFASALFWAVAFVIAYLNTAYMVFVGLKIWRWFLLPAGYKMPPFSVALGVDLIIGVLFTGLYSMILTRAEKPSEGNSAVEAVTMSLSIAAAITMSWASAYVWHFWLGY